MPFSCSRAVMSKLSRWLALGSSFWAICSASLTPPLLVLFQRPAQAPPGHGAVGIVARRGLERAARFHPDVGVVIGQSLIEERLALGRVRADAVGKQAQARMRFGRRLARPGHLAVGFGNGDREPGLSGSGGQADET